jgi:hypothetical protein
VLEGFASLAGVLEEVLVVSNLVVIWPTRHEAAILLHKELQYLPVDIYLRLKVHEASHWLRFTAYSPGRQSAVVLVYYMLYGAKGEAKGFLQVGVHAAAVLGKLESY